MFQEVVSYLAGHPVQLGVLILTIILAAIGLWYVVYNHLQVILITLLCAAGTGSGALVLFRGVKAEMRDLIGVGMFLVAVFPIIFFAAIRLSKRVPAKAPSAADRGHAKRAGAAT